jgi:plastocyanin
MLFNTAITILIKLAISEIPVLSVILLSAYPMPFYVVAEMQEAVPPHIQQISIVYGSSFPNNTKFYDPPSVSIPVGTEVNWSNNDISFHTVTFVTEGIFDSGIVSPGNSTSNIFSKQGIFNYYCKIHPYMIGELRIA